jgi:hypothetical protein
MPARFSEHLDKWLNGKQAKTLGSLEEVFQEKGFAIAILMLMFLPALPLPTGGISHAFEVIVMLLSLEMIIGRKTIWLPKRWRNFELGNRTIGKALPFIRRRIAWFENFARPRLTHVVEHRFFSQTAGLIIFVFTLGAFLAPPFSGMDTLPALGVVAIAMSIILGDAAIFALGCLIGISGITLVLLFGTAIFEASKRLL